MSSNTPERDQLLGSLQSEEGEGIVRMEDRLEVRTDEVWSALTDPGRLATWLGEVNGDLRLGGKFRARFSRADGKARVAWSGVSRRAGYWC